MLYEEIGELAQVQLMMRQQGSLYLAASLCESLEGEGHERAASSRFTLALRHYERALAPHLLAQSAVSPAMELCAAEARVELATFYLARANSNELARTSNVAAADRIKHLEAALGHARAVSSEGVETSKLPTSVLEKLVETEQRALLELIRAHSAHGNVARAASLKDDYRSALQRAASMLHAPSAA